ncbi:MAG: VOC family protein, partial [Pseudomonadota bacterium]
MIKARRILETVLYAEDLAAARRFYGEVLGLPVYQEVDHRLVVFRCAGQMLLIFNPEPSSAQSSSHGPPPHGAKGNGHVCFSATAAELETWQQHLDARGIAVERLVD